MIAKSFLLVLLVAAACATPVTQDNSMIGYSDAVGMFLQAWQKIIPCGFAAENLPVLAPLNIDFYAFNYSNGNTNLVGNVSNIRISGLNNFQILSGGYDNNTQRAHFDVIFPQLQILGAYELEGTFGVGGLPLPVRQNVLLNKKLIDWRFVGEYTFAESNSNGLRISDVDLKYFVADVQSDHWDKYLDVAANNFVNNFIESFSMLFTEEIQPYVNTLFGMFVLPTINDLISELDLTQLTNYFVAQADIWNNADCSVQA
ncbi:uncharacterized protein LOC132785138 [Drosophila nasuta]|uniref:uncharacterized protein LOC132785138 n=1 Tax=Drosophila nasuta TaxID=42062 RepID=UPI00295EDD69|nr:uncharacterized protein LOC132785138 [Drosophila nasuta]